MIEVTLRSEVKTIYRNDVEKVKKLNLLPNADYTNLKSFIGTIPNEELGEVIILCEKTDNKEMAEYLSHIIGLIFMNEYEVDEFRNIDFSNLLMKFYRQCVSEACQRVGVWDSSKEDKRLVIDNEPF